MKYRYTYFSLLLFVVCSSCEGQNQTNLPKDNSKSETKDAVTSSRGADETSFHTKQVYTDAMGKRLTLHNSYPKGGGYIDATGKSYRYAVFYTRITNETSNPVELNIDLPSASFEFPLSSGNYMKLLTPSDTMTTDKVSLFDYGLSIKSFLDTGINKSYALKRTVNPKDSIAFYVVTQADKGVDGVLRTGLSIKGQALIYTISAYKSTPGHPLLYKKEITCGDINSENLLLLK